VKKLPARSRPTPNPSKEGSRTGRVRNAVPLQGGARGGFEDSKRELSFANLQRTKPINRRQLQAITEATLAELDIANWNLTFYLVGTQKMAEINEGHMHHEGPTDVITFNYGDHASRLTPHALLGEIFICVDVAVTQAREFHTTWQSEIVRYIVHALLHLCGYDDLSPAARREMKRHENRLVRKLSRQFNFAALSRP
jgi:probable rRNA maturation factor